MRLARQKTACPRRTVMAYLAKGARSNTPGPRQASRSVHGQSSRRHFPVVFFDVSRQYLQEFPQAGKARAASVAAWSGASRAAGMSSRHHVHALLIQTTPSGWREPARRFIALTALSACAWSATSSIAMSESPRSAACPVRLTRPHPIRSLSGRPNPGCPFQPADHWEAIRRRPWAECQSPAERGFVDSRRRRTDHDRADRPPQRHAAFGSVSAVRRAPQGRGTRADNSAGAANGMSGRRPQPLGTHSHPKPGYDRCQPFRWPSASPATAAPPGSAWPARPGPSSRARCAACHCRPA